ncbi:MAG: hypothetical protein G01um10147_625 [Microgenomates group bacterium Gr01-1014_7]|nr:MAG: hypothetical protein G01um10147_625 [Microgenomates group bacterium Gr01-1014_7]
MDNVFNDFLENLVNECLQGAKFAYLSEKDKKEIARKLRDHFYSVTIDTLVDQLSDEQINQIKGLDPKAPEMEQKMAEFAASIPGFAFVLEDKLKIEMDKILQTGQIS